MQFYPLLKHLVLNRIGRTGIREYFAFSWGMTTYWLNLFTWSPSQAGVIPSSSSTLKSDVTSTWSLLFHPSWNWAMQLGETSHLTLRLVTSQRLSILWVEGHCVLLFSLWVHWKAVKSSIRLGWSLLYGLNNRHPWLMGLCSPAVTSF